MGYHLTALVTCLSLAVFFVLTFQVGRARGKYSIEAPATTGHPMFERSFRVHYNTMESMAMYLPALWLFAFNVSDRWAAALGVVWIVGRIVYARGYLADPKKRGTGTIITIGAEGTLLVGALIGVLVQLAK